MGKKFVSEDDYTISETGNWNVADSFSRVKIMGPMIKSEIYEDVATYGFDSFFEELANHGVSNDELKVRGLYRLINELIRLTKNTMFAMKKEKTREELTKIQKKLFKIKSDIFRHTYRKIINEGTRNKDIKLNEPLFSRTLEVVSKLKSDLNFPLNKNHLIFVDKQEFDPAAFKNKIRDRIVNKG